MEEYMEEYKVPTPPTDHEPTLNQLIKFVDKHSITEDELVRGVNHYKNTFKDYFYLYGQLKMDKNEPITTELILEAIKTSKERLKKFPPANYAEFASIQRSEDMFQSFLQLLTVYYNFIYGLLSQR